MHVVRDRRENPEADREVTAHLVDRVRETGEAGRRVWTPPRQVSFGPRDRRADGYDRARRAASERGYPATERDAGGRAVAYAGSTVAFVLAEPVDGSRAVTRDESDRDAADRRRGIRARYDAATAALRAALSSLRVDAAPGEPPDSFCPGSHSLQADGKIVGLAQRVRREVTLVGGVVVTRDHEALAAVLTPVYAALALPFDPDSVGSVARTGGDGRPEAVVDAVEAALSEMHES
ncbi:MAG: lipoate--protein ligase family protein [Haloarculaceae archaeon]